MMLHGKQTIVLSHQSVTEALNDYLQKHMLSSVAIGVCSWATAPGYADQTVTVEFAQDAGPADSAGESP